MLDRTEHKRRPQSKILSTPVRRCRAEQTELSYVGYMSCICRSVAVVGGRAIYRRASCHVSLVLQSDFIRDSSRRIMDNI